MNPSEFRDGLLVESNGEPRMLGEIIEPWQQADFKAMDPAWTVLAGFPVEGDVIRRFWLERARGHSKTSDIAVAVLWLLLFAPRSVKGVAAAADRDQAKLLLEAIQRLVSLNGWSTIIDVQQGRVLNRKTGSVLEVITSDAMTSYGLLVDFIVCDELTHWRNRDLWDSLLSTAAKKSRCLLLVITNAGWSDSWQYETRELIRENPEWFFSHQDGPVASWITESSLAEQRLLLPEPAYRRLWLNEWSSGTGDALTGETIDAAVAPEHAPMSGQESGFAFAAGLDLGVKRDKSALAVVGKDRSNRLWLAYSRTWSPGPDGMVDLMDVEETILSVARRFRAAVSFDPWQAALMRQRIASKVGMKEIPFSGSNLQAMATATLEAFNSRNISLFLNDELIGDLKRLRVEERSYGFRLVSPRTGAGHGDLATAFQLAVLGTKTIQAQPVYGSKPQGARGGLYIDLGRSYQSCTGKRIF